MPRSRSRSRSFRRGERERDFGNGERKQDVIDAAQRGGSEQEIVSVAIKQLTHDIRERLEKLFDEGLLKEGDLDLRSVTVFASLNEGLQGRVMNHMENERIYVANARSKSGFLIATCDKAKTGCLDARGLGAIDPWRTALAAMATPKQKLIDLQPEAKWLEEHPGPIRLNVTGPCVESDLSLPSVSVELPLNETSAALKAKLATMGIKTIPPNKMKLHTEPVGFLKDRLSFAFYNLADGVMLQLSERGRGGVRLRKDHSVMPRRREMQEAQQNPPAANPLEQLQKIAVQASGSKLGQTGFPALCAPGTSPAAGLAQLTGPGGMVGTSPAGMPGAAQLWAGLKLPGSGMPPALPTLPSPGGAGTMPGLGTAGLGGLPAFASGPAGLASALGGLAKSGAVPGAPDPRTAGDMMAALGGKGFNMGGGCGKAAPMMQGDPKAAALAMMATSGEGRAAAPSQDAKMPSAPGMSMSDPNAAAMAMMASLPPVGADPKAAAMAMVAQMQAKAPMPNGGGMSSNGLMGKAAPGMSPMGMGMGPMGGMNGMGMGGNMMPGMGTAKAPSLEMSVKAQMPLPGTSGLSAPMGATAKAGGPA